MTSQIRWRHKDYSCFIFWRELKRRANKFCDKCQRMLQIMRGPPHTPNIWCDREDDKLVGDSFSSVDSHISWDWKFVPPPEWWYFMTTIFNLRRRDWLKICSDSFTGFGLWFFWQLMRLHRIIERMNRDFNFVATKLSKRPMLTRISIA